MATKKQFDLEEMYRKIMPTDVRQVESESETEASPEHTHSVHHTTEPELTEREEDREDVSFLTTKEINWVGDPDNTPILYNITERIVIEKLDFVLQKMTCCKCDRCKKDIIALALNDLKPQYVVNLKNVIERKVEHYENTQAITSAVLKAALTVRKMPRH